MKLRNFLAVANAVLFIVLTISMLTPATLAASKYKTLYKFTGGNDGGGPYSSLVFDQAGYLYGTTQYGGAYGKGVVFQLIPNADGSWTETVLCTFTGGKDGANPYAGVILDALGNAYGTTTTGGAYGHGVVFKLTPNIDGTWTEIVLHPFRSGRDGDYPLGGLVMDANGSLFGTTLSGGSAGQGSGTAFQLTPNSDGSWTYRVGHRFTYGRDGGRPAGTLIFDSAGNLYGTTSDEGIRHASGTVFALTPNADGSWTHTVLHRFAGKGVKGPRAGLTLDPAGNLYGTATVGGPADGGGVFKLSPQLDGTWAYSTVRLFEGTPALHPYGGLILDSSGNLYGTASECGSKLENQKHCKGVVFELMP